MVYKWDLANFQLWGAVFRKEPPLPPSPAQATVRCQNPMSDKSVDRHTFLQTLKSLLTNKNYVLLLISYGINAGVFYAVSTLLNQIVLLHFAVSSAGTAFNIPAYLYITPSDLALFLRYLRHNSHAALPSTIHHCTHWTDISYASLRYPCLCISYSIIISVASGSAVFCLLITFPFYFLANKYF